MRSSAWASNHWGFSKPARIILVWPWHQSEEIGYIWSLRCFQLISSFFYHFGRIMPTMPVGMLNKTIVFLGREDGWKEVLLWRQGGVGEHIDEREMYRGTRASATCWRSGINKFQVAGGMTSAATNWRLPFILITRKIYIHITFSSSPLWHLQMSLLSTTVTNSQFTTI